MTITTGVSYSAKSEFPMAAHCFLATQAGLSMSATSTVTVTGLASTAGIVQGMGVTGTNVPANTVVARILSGTSIELSKATTGACTSITVTGDAFLIALIKSGAGSYSGTQTNYGAGSGSPTTSNLGTDEVASGSGYTTGGFALTNTSPQVGTTAGFWSFGVNPSWTSASFSTIGGLLYSNSARMGAASVIVGRAIAEFDFGGTQTVSAGTLTILLPTNAQGTAILQIS